MSRYSPDCPETVEDAGADALSLINTITGMSWTLNGGYPPEKYHRRAVRSCHQTRGLEDGLAGRKAGFHTGDRIGGIATAADALEFLIVGAGRCRWGRRVSSTPGCHGYSGRTGSLSDRSWTEGYRGPDRDPEGRLKSQGADPIKKRGF